MKNKAISILALCGTLVFASFGLFAQSGEVRAAEIRDIRFPVVGPVWYGNDFGAPRVGHSHEGNDIFGVKGQQLVAAVSGTVRFVPYPQPSYGYYVSIEAPDGWTYHYLHLNNDKPGTDDGDGGATLAYAPDMKRGNRVTAGQLIGWMGDSGNAETTPPHLHFEIHDPDGNPINPFDSLYYAPRLSEPVTDYPALDDEILPYRNFHGGAYIAMGELDARYEGDELVSGAAKGGGPHVRIMNQEGKTLSHFMAFEESMRGGVDLAIADVDGDDVNDIIVAAGENSSPRVRVFDKLGNMKLEFTAFETWFKGGVRIAAADLDDDGKAEILTAPGKDYAPWLKIYSGEGKHQSEFLAYGIGFHGGFDVSAIGTTDTTTPLVVVGAAQGGGPHVRVFHPDGTRESQFFSYGEGFRGGIRVDIADVYPESEGPEIVTSPQSSGGPDFRAYSLRGKKIQSFTQFERWWKGGYDIAAGNGNMFVSSLAGRRASIRNIK